MSWFSTIEDLRRRFVTGEENLRNDEYLEGGLPYCSKCNTPRFFTDGNIAVRCMCKCESEAIERERERGERKKVMDEFYNRKTLSLLGQRYSCAIFRNAVITENNRGAFDKAKNYVENHEKVLQHNIGLYIYGDNSTGKTFLSACICNELVWRKQYCVYTNLASILNEIRASYDGKGEGECALLARLRNYSFAFIDDLGKEFLGREYRPESSKWAEEKLFEVLNERYNAQKPTVFSSNYSIGELDSVLGLDKAIVERVNEMATRVIRLEGDDFRKVVQEEKSDIAKSLGI